MEMPRAGIYRRWRRLVSFGSRGVAISHELGIEQINCTSPRLDIYFFRAGLWERGNGNVCISEESLSMRGKALLDRIYSNRQGYCK